MAKYVGYKRPADAKKTMRQLLHYMGIHKWAMMVIAILVMIGSGANIMGTYLLKPVINDHLLKGDMEGFVLILGRMGLMYLGGVLATFSYNQLMVRTAQKIVSEIRHDLFVHTQKLPLPYFDVHTHGELMSRFTNDVDTITEALNSSFTMLIQSFVTIVGTVTMLLVLSIRLSLIVVFFLAAMILFIRFNGKRSKKYFQEQQKALGSINGFIEEMIAGQKVEKVFHHEEADLREFLRRNEALRQASTKALTYSGMTVPTIVSLSYVNYAVSACAGGLFVIGGWMDLGTLASYLIYVRQSAMPFNQFTQQLNFLMAALAGAERIFDMMNAETESEEGSVALVERDGKFFWRKREEDGTQSETVLRGDVRFEHVTFGYQKEHPILKDVSLYAKPGQKIAFVGSTGAGKTTVMNLINRFYEIDSGRITYDEIDIQKIKKEDLRRSLSMVIQDTHLFTGTIADNIRYGRLEATDEEVIEAAKIANADSFIRRLPDGYETMLYGDGKNLSQGQRQLLAIARAAVTRPPVLILDEATSSIDTRTERMIEKGMDALMENRTVFVIAHRLSTVRNAQAILVLEKGIVMERGSHEELLEKKGRYYELYTGQREME
ncbi:MAG: ABC transporter ATP-binding protein/permease [Robinsoniella sp.]|nr:ABC transporter ATP-binding protein/permease [Robinsoniella sp.]